MARTGARAIGSREVLESSEAEQGLLLVPPEGQIDPLDQGFGCEVGGVTTGGNGFDDVGGEVLARPLPKSGVPAMAKLLEAARAKTCRIWAENSPYDSKDALKRRKYRWNGGEDGRPKAWFCDLPEGDVATELAWLRQEIYQYDADIPVKRVTAFDRFSDRV